MLIFFDVISGFSDNYRILKVLITFLPDMRYNIYSTINILIQCFFLRNNINILILKRSDMGGAL